MIDQMFQGRLDRRIIPSVHSTVSMVLLQLHGIPGWGDRPVWVLWRRNGNASYAAFAA